jgi:hypothetical protein
VRVLRALGGVLLWLLAAVVGLLGALLSVTLVLLPIGIPLLLLAKRLFTTSVQLLVSPKVAHPVREMQKASKRRGRDVTDAASDTTSDVVTKVRKAAKRHGRRHGGLRGRLGLG